MFYFTKEAHLVDKRILTTLERQANGEVEGLCILEVVDVVET